MSVVTAVAIGDQNFMQPKLLSMICSSKAPTELCRIEKQDITFDLQEGTDFIVYLNIKHVYSAILTYISKNFDVLYSDPNIKLLTEDEMKILLKHKYLNV